MRDEGTGGAAVAAFFDVDGTITRSNVVEYYLWYRQRDMSAGRRFLDLIAFVPKAVRYWLLEKTSRRRFVKDFYRNYRGVDADDLARWHRESFETRTLPRIRAAAVEAIERHRAEGHRLVIVSGAVDSRVLPLAEHLGVRDVLSVQLAAQNGRLTGYVDGSLLVDSEKAKAAEAYARRFDVDLAVCYAYGDSFSDAAILEAVGHPAVVNPRGRLLRLARRKGWTICSW